MRPSDIDVIIDMRQIGEHQYLSLKEAGNPMQSRVLSWFFQYVLKTGMNAVWEVNGGLSWVGNPEFNSLMAVKN
jgi:DNA-binding phage protein